MLTALGILLAAWGLRGLVKGLRGGVGRALPALAALLAGAACLAWPAIAIARMAMVLGPGESLQTHNWAVNPAVTDSSPIRWEGDVLIAELETGSGHYALFPVEWRADRFEAEWDLTVERMELPGHEIRLKSPRGEVAHRRTAFDHASVAIGLADHTASNLDDRDHISGSGVQAAFSTDIRLRVADANFLLRTSSSTESGSAELDPGFQPRPPVPVRPGDRFHCRLAYDRRTREAELIVSAPPQPPIRRVVEEVREFTGRVAWFGVTVRNFNRYDKKLWPERETNGYVRPKARVRIENLRYAQP